MDKLAREASIAKREQLSYGKWKALQPIVHIEPKKFPEYHCMTELECQYCGKSFRKRAGTRYCSKSCCALASYYRRKEQTEPPTE